MASTTTRTSFLLTASGSTQDSKSLVLARLPAAAGPVEVAERGQRNQRERAEEQAEQGDRHRRQHDQRRQRRRRLLELGLEVPRLALPLPAGGAGGDVAGDERGKRSAERSDQERQRHRDFAGSKRGGAGEYAERRSADQNAPDGHDRRQDHADHESRRERQADSQADIEKGVH